MELRRPTLRDGKEARHEEGRIEQLQIRRSRNSAVRALLEMEGAPSRVVLKQ